MQTRGLIQRLQVVPAVDLPGSRDSTVVWVEVGPSPTDTQLFTITRLSGDPPEQDVFKATMVDVLIGAYANNMEVIVFHDDDGNDVKVTGVELPPV